MGMLLKHHVFKLACVVVPVLFISTAGHSQDQTPVELRFKFEVGQIVRYNVDLQDNYKIQINESVDEPYTKQKTKKSYQVLAVDAAGNADLQLTFDEIQLEIFQNGELEKFDTRNPKAGSESPVFQALLNTTSRPHLQVTVGPTGVVKETKSLVEGQPAPESSTATFDVLIGLPEHPVKVGDAWKEDLSVSIPLEGNPNLNKMIKLQRQYLFKSYDQNLATIEVKTKVITPLNGAGEEMQALRRTPSGSFQFDTKRGLLVGKNLSQDNTVTGVDGGASLIEFKQTLVEQIAQ